MNSGLFENDFGESWLDPRCNSSKCQKKQKDEKLQIKPY